MNLLKLRSSSFLDLLDAGAFHRRPESAEWGRRFRVEVLRPPQERGVPQTRPLTDVERKTSLVGFFGF